MRVLPYLLGGMFITGVLLFLLSLQQLRRRRTGSYWRMRRQAGERGGRLFVIGGGLIVGSLILTLISGIVLLVRPINDGLIRGPEDLYGIVLPSASAQTATGEFAVTATQMRAETLTVPTLTPVIEMMPTVAATVETPVPTSTSAPSTNAPATATLAPPTAEPSATSDFAVLLNLTPVFNMTPRPPTSGFRLRLNAASSTLVDGDPPPPEHEFSAGLRRIYLYMSYEQMENGVAWSRVLYRDGTPLQGNTLLWSLGAAGSTYFFFGDENGYAPGDYEIRLFVGDQEVSRYPFEVKP